MKTIKTVLTILILLSVCSAQSDSLKHQVNIATTMMVATVATGVVATIETGKAGYVATIEAYNSKMVQNGIDSGKKGATKLWNLTKSYIDSVKK